LRRAWALNLDVVVVNQFFGCADSADGGSIELVADLLTVRIPDCAGFYLFHATPDIPDDRSDVSFGRDGVGTYAFPGGTPSDVDLNGWGPDALVPDRSEAAGCHRYRLRLERSRI
jgi:hypothetical protein